MVEIKIRSLEESEIDTVAENLKISPSNQIDLSQFKFDEKIKLMIQGEIDSLTTEERKRRLHADLNLFKCINELC